MRQFLGSIALPFVAAITLTAPTPAIAQVLPSVESEFLPPLRHAQQSVAFVSQERAYRYATPIRLYPGRSEMIDFRTDEVITYIQLSDLSGIVYQTNAPLESGQAKLIALRRIEELDFPGQTESPVPNLLVTTIDPQGEQRTYIFNLIPHNRQPHADDTNGVAIVTAAEAQTERLNLRRNEGYLTGETTLTVDTLPTALGVADIDDIVRGLDTAIALGYTPANDPVVALAQTVIDLVEAGTPLRQAIQDAGLPIEVAIALGEIGRRRHFFPIDGPEPPTEAPAEDIEPRSEEESDDTP